MSSLSACVHVTPVSCCINGTILYRYESLPGAPSPSIPPGMEGLSPAEFNPFSNCLAEFDFFASGTNAAFDATARKEYAVIEALLSAAVILAVAGMAWKAYRFGLQSLWHVRRLPGPHGSSWLVVNPSTTYLWPFLGLVVTTILGCEAARMRADAFEQLAATGQLPSISYASYQFLLGALSTTFIFFCGWCQGFGLLFSIPRFLGDQSSIWVVDRTKHPFGLHRIHPTLLNTIFVVTPLVLLAFSIGGGIAGAHATREAFEQGGAGVGGLTALSAAYIQADGKSLPGFADGGVSRLDAIFASLHPISRRLNVAIKVCFIPLITFNIVFLLAYTRFAWTIVNLIVRQLRVLRQTASHFDRSRLEVPPQRDGGYIDVSPLDKHTSLPSIRTAVASDERNGVERTMGVERSKLILRLKLSLAATLSLGFTIVACSLLSAILSFWAVLGEKLPLIERTALAQYWIWSLSAFIAVTCISVLGTQAPPGSSPRLPDSRERSTPEGDEEDPSPTTVEYGLSVSRRGSVPAVVHAQEVNLVPLAFDGPVSPPLYPESMLSAAFSSTERVHEAGTAMQSFAEKKVRRASHPSPPRSGGDEVFTPSRHFRAAVDLPSPPRSPRRAAAAWDLPQSPPPRVPAMAQRPVTSG